MVTACIDWSLATRLVVISELAIVIGILSLMYRHYVKNRD